MSWTDSEYEQAPIPTDDYHQQASAEVDRLYIEAGNHASTSAMRSIEQGDDDVMHLAGDCASSWRRFEAAEVSVLWDRDLVSINAVQAHYYAAFFDAVNVIVNPQAVA